MSERFYKTPQAQLKTDDDFEPELSIAGILRSTIHDLAEKFPNLVMALALPILLLQVCNATIRMFSKAIGSENIDEAYLIANYFLAISLVSALIWGLLAVACHRVLLNDPQPPTLFNGIWLGRRQVRYLIRAAILGFPIGFSMGVLLVFYQAFFVLYVQTDDSEIPSTYISTLASQVIVLPLHYLIARFSLVLPATALGQPMTFGQSWAETSGNGWRLTCILISAPFVASFLYPIFSTDNPSFFWPSYIASNVITLVAAVIAIAALSKSYDWFMNNDLGG